MASKRKRAGDGLRDLEDIKAHIEKRLFVGRLPTNFSQDELGDVFSVYGRLTECKMVPGRGVGFVGFETWGAAHRAVLQTDGRPIVGGASQPAIVSFAERTSTVGRGGGAHLSKGNSNSRLFVGGLAEAVTEREINDMFSPFGNVEDIKLLPSKGHRRCGFVILSLWGEALDAIEGLDGQDNQDRRDAEPLTVVLAEPKEGGSAGSAGRPFADDANGETPLGALRGEGPLKRRRLDGGGGSESTRAEFESTLMSYFRAMDSAASAELCDELHAKLMQLRVEHARCGQSSRPEGPTVHLREASRPGGSEPRRRNGLGAAEDSSLDVNRLFIGGLPKECSDEELRALVDQISVSASGSDLIECRTLVGRGCGYLRFASSRAAEEAIEALNDRRVNGWKDILRARWAEPKGTSGGSEVDPPTPQGAAGGGHMTERRIADTRRRSARDVGARPEADEECGEDDGLDHRRLFVGQIQRRCDKERLYQVFEPFGWIEEFRFLEEKGVAYVSFDRAADATRALRELNGSTVDDISRGTGGLNVQFSKKR